MLYPHLQIKPDKRELISLVGAGGKTTAMFKLADELRTQGARVLVTTTTAIYCPLLHTGMELSLDPLPPVLPAAGIMVWGRTINSENKLLGVAPELIDEVYGRQEFDFILVEADGARNRAVKVPAGHEPPVPAATTIYIGVIGLRCLGTPAGGEYVHRSSLWCQLTEADPHDLIQESHLSRLITHPQGLFKNSPLAGKRYLLLNQANTPERRQAGSRIIREAVADSFRIAGGILTDLHSDSYQGIYTSPFVTGIIMASGYSRRMGQNKLMLDYQGIPLVERVIRAAQASGLQDILLIYRDERVRELGARYGLKTVFNPRARYGQSEAVKLGVREASPETHGFMFLPGDQPLISASLINDLLANFATGGCQVIQPYYDGQPGSPVIFSSQLREELLRLRGDCGGRSVISRLDPRVIKKVEVLDALQGMDVDTIKDYVNLPLGEGRTCHDTV